MKAPRLLIRSIMLLIAGSLTAQTTVPGGEVYGSWPVSGSPYLIKGDITIPNDSTLRIEPGVKVEFQGHYALVVLGRLLSIGTETDSILFTVNDTTGFSDPDTSLGGWYGIRFLDTPVNNDSSKISFCRLEYGKAIGPVWHLNAGGAICILQFGKVLISDCLIRNCIAVSTTEEAPIGGGLYLFRSDVNVRNNTFINNGAHSGGAIFFDESNAVFADNVIENNHATYGGGIAIGSRSIPTFNGDKILDNVAGSHGGGILFGSSIVRISNLTVTGNRADWGGGIGIQGGELQAEGCRLENNFAEIWGGGIAGDFATLDLKDCVFKGDSSGWGSGGLHMDHSTTNISDCRFIENRAIIGGGIHAVFSKITSDKNEFINNISEGGGGMHIEDSDCTISLSLFKGNIALNGTGGGIDYSVDSTIFGRCFRFELYGTTIRENFASNHSGGARIEQLGTEFSMVNVEVDSCYFTGNRAGMYGPLRLAGFIKDIELSNTIFNGNSTWLHTPGPALTNHTSCKAINCVFHSNYVIVSDSITGIQEASVGMESTAEFYNCIFTDTIAANGSGLVVRRGSEIYLTNCIFWRCGNHPINLITALGPGCNVSVNYCDVEFGTDSIEISDSLSVLSWGNGNLNKDPSFEDPASGNWHLQDDSPCIGSGVNSFILNDRWFTAPLRDIEGNKRPQPEGSQADIGAYEHTLGEPIQIVPAINDYPIDGGKIMICPNPFSHFTTISYSFPEECYVNLSIYGLTGQLITTLVSEVQPEGTHRVSWDGSGCSEGFYFYRLGTSDRIIQTGKILLLK